MKTKQSISVVGLIAAATLLAACGTTEPAQENTTPAEESEATEAGPITVTDGRGEEVTLEDGPAQEVVALEWAQVDMAVSLGVQPVGVADPQGYESWAGTAVPLEGEVTDVGIRREPSIDTIAGLEPDLIIGVVGSIPDDAMDQMERIAPIVLLQGANAEDPLGAMEENFRLVAELLGKEAEADTVVEDFQTTLEDNAAAITDAGVAGTPVVLASPYAEGANLSIRMHGPRTAPQQVAEQMGLDPAWTDPGDDEYGLSNTDVEGLIGMPDDTVFLYWGNEGTEDPVENDLDGNAVWDSLPFVEDDNVHEAAVGIWVYGGPGSLAAWSDDLTEILVD